MGCVYFIKHNELEPIKIGMTIKETPCDRVSQMSTASPYGIELLGFVKTFNPILLERELHDKYKDLRLNGEWFNISREVAFNEITLLNSSESIIINKLPYEVEKYVDSRLGGFFSVVFYESIFIRFNHLFENVNIESYKKCLLNYLVGKDLIVKHYKEAKYFETQLKDEAYV